MGHSEFWDENFYFARETVNPETPELLIAYFFDSVWRPGVRTPSGGGKYLVHSLVLEGHSKTIFPDGTVGFMAPGDISISPRQYSAGFVVGDVPLRRKAFSVFPNRLCRSVLMEMFGSDDVLIRLSDPARVERYMDSIKAEMCAEQSREKLSGLWFSLLHELRRQQRADPVPPKLRRILEYIDRHLAEPELSRESIASAAGTSVRTLCRLFEVHMKTTPAGYISRQRLERAARMLPIRTLSLKEIAARTGFSSLNYLCRVFREKYGTSPGESRSDGQSVIVSGP